MLRVLGWIVGVVILLIVAGYVAFRVSPWPGAMAIRAVFDMGGARLAAALEPHVPPGVTAVLGQSYDPADPDARLDIFTPEGMASDARLPVIFWTHGGGFVAGDKKDVTPYLKILASEGYVAIGINYTRAPEAKYPTPLKQMNAAMAWTLANVARYGGDPARIVMAGDSAGAQLTAQYAALATDAAYAAKLGIDPVIDPEALRGVLLFCGVYDAASFADNGGLIGMFLTTVLRSYFGTDDAADPRVAEFSVTGHVSAAFPPAFITVGNDDPLEPQSRALAARLGELGVSVDALLFDPGHEPKLPHEYQYDLDGADGRQVLIRVLAFLAARTG